MKRCHLRTGNAFSNVPGIALYMTGLNQVRGFMAVSPLFAAIRKRDLERHSSVLPVLTNTGNLLAGATTRVAVGFVLNPVSVLKARYEVSTFFAPLYAFLTSAHLLLFLSQSNLHAYGSLISSVRLITRGGPSELFRGFLASSLRATRHTQVFFWSSTRESSTKPQQFCHRRPLWLLPCFTAARALPLAPSQPLQPIPSMSSRLVTFFFFFFPFVFQIHPNASLNRTIISWPRADSPGCVECQYLFSIAYNPLIFVYIEGTGHIWFLRWCFPPPL